MTDLSLALDATLAATSGAGVLYCAVLSRRLAALRSAKAGVTPALRALTDAVRESRAAAEAITEAAEGGVRRLNAAYAELGEKRQATDDLCGVLDGQAGRVEARIGAARIEAERAVAGALEPLEGQASLVVQTAERTLSVLARRARIELEALSDAVEIAHRVTTLTDPAASTPRETGEPRGAAEPVPLNAARGAIRQRPAAGGNPFLVASADGTADEAAPLRAVGS